MRLRALLLDFDGVVAESGFHAAVGALAAHAGRPHDEVARAAMRALRASGYLTGKGTEAAFWGALEDALGVRADPLAFRRALVTGSRVRPEMLALVQEVTRAGVAVLVLSDHTDWLDEIERRTPFARHFGHVRNSYYTGLTKGEPTAFAAALAALGAAPADVLFADDNARNVACAAGCGIAALHYDGAGWSGLRSALVRAGLTSV